MKNDCPFWKGPCKEHECRLYVQLIGTNVNTGQPVNEWNCSFTWLPQMQVETTQQVRQLGAAIESLRNIVDHQNQQYQLFEENGIKFIKEH